jgi:transposase InsO family protein
MTAQRYERQHPGELVHIDEKKLGPIPDGGAGARMAARSRHRMGLPADFTSNAERTDALPTFLDYYNHRRRHTAIGDHPPISRLSTT